MKMNHHYGELKASYLFVDIAHKVAAYQEAHPEKEIIRMGIGDVTQPLAKCVVEAMHQAADEMGTKEGFHGYGPEQGYPFLKQAIQGYYAGRGTKIEEDEIFISDGAKSDLANILGLFDVDNTVLVPDPVYPTYVDDNVTDGRKIIYSRTSEENGFLGMPDENVKADIIYICSPNNPTGAAYTREQLKEWVAYAKKNNAIILYDAAYECFISDGALARSIFEIEGARECAIEICSFSKIAGFTGTRCGYTVVPKELEREGMNINKLWLRRQTTKFNGVSYINDSIATSPTRTIAGLRAMRTKPILIAGGHDKHVSFDRLADEIAERVKALYLTGDTAEQIEKAVRKSVFFDPSRLPIYVVPDLKTAVEEARAHSIPGDVVLLSPACSSFDRFKNFAERGDTFRKIVLEFEGNETE